MFKGQNPPSDLKLEEPVFLYTVLPLSTMMSSNLETSSSESSENPNNNSVSMDSSNIPEVPVSQEAPVKQEPERKGSYRATFTFHAEKPANSWSDSSIPANNIARRKFKLEVSSLQAKSREELALRRSRERSHLKAKLREESPPEMTTSEMFTRLMD